MRIPYVTYYRKFDHGLVVIGDDFACGFGDITNLGSPGGLPLHLVRKLRQDKTLKHGWLIYNRGVMGSTTADWVPKSKRAEDGAGGAGLFEKTFDAKLVARCEIVVVMLGFWDGRSTKPLISPERTVDNLQSICTVLRDMGKDVWVLPFSMWSDDRLLSPEQVEANKTRSQLVTDYLKTNSIGAKMGPDTSGLSYEFKSKDFYYDKGPYFATTGYKKLAKDVHDLIGTTLVQKEFASMKKALGL
ncbi:hypothetical protein HK101_005466 [Irineochytrium annulatum]|nr:hypothetical protein HK101_005466 [Irineochytrium annulatum]